MFLSIIINIFNLFSIFWIFYLKKYNITNAGGIIDYNMNFLVIILILNLLLKLSFIITKKYFNNYYLKFYLNYLNICLLIINFFLFTGIGFLWYKILLLEFHFIDVGFISITIFGTKFYIVKFLTHEDKINHIVEYWKLKNKIFNNKAFVLTNDEVNNCLRFDNYSSIDLYLDSLFEKKLIYFQSIENSWYNYFKTFFSSSLFIDLLVAGSVVTISGFLIYYLFNINIINTFKNVFFEEKYNIEHSKKVNESLNSIKEHSNVNFKLTKLNSNNNDIVVNELINSNNYTKAINLKNNIIEKNLSDLSRNYKEDIPVIINEISKNNIDFKDIKTNIDTVKNTFTPELIDLLNQEGLFVEFTELINIRKKYNFTDGSKSVLKLFWNLLLNNNNNKFESQFKKKNPSFPGEGRVIGESKKSLDDDDI